MTRVHGGRLRSARSRVVVAAVVSSFAVLASACAPRPRMCTSSLECRDASASACVAGRCQVERPTLKPAVESARRLVVRPADVAYVTAGPAPRDGALPTVFALGRDRSKLFLRFAVTVPPTATVVEAYVVLRRSSLVDDDPAPVSLHATRIVEAWSGGSVTWGRQPRTVDGRSPSTLVEPGGSALVRLDVRELVRHWARRDPADHGIAIVADGDAATGTTFALSGIGGGGAERAAVEPAILSRGAATAAAAGDVEPYLELYVR